MTRKLLSFLTGVILASAWWQAAVFKYGSDGKDQWAVAGFVTGLFCLIFLLNCCIHIDDDK